MNQREQRNKSEAMQQNKVTLLQLFTLLVLVIPVHLFGADKKIMLGKAYYEAMIDDPISHVNQSINQADALSSHVPEEHEEVIIPRHLSPGRMYYKQLLEEEQRKSWSTQLVLRSSVATKGFNDDSQRRPLANALFGGDVTLKSIYLPSKLAALNKVRIDNVDARELIRPQAATEGFGSYASDQYVFLLSGATLNPNLEAREAGIDFNTAFRFILGERQGIQGIVGLLVPIKTRLHIFNLNVKGGSLFTASFSPFGVIRNNPLDQFNLAYTGLLDFFERGVLEPKGLEFKGRQRAIGVGDINVFCLFDFADYLELLSCLQVGTNMILPSGKVASQNVLFEPGLGAGALQFDFFVNTVFSTRARMFNPAFHLVWNIAPSYATTQRIPKRITNAERQQISSLAATAKGLFNIQTVPEVFRNYYVDPFSEFDSDVPAFASNAFPITLSRAQRILIGVGSYAYDILSTGAQLAIFYDIMHKGADKFVLDKTACKGQSLNVKALDLDIAGASELTSERSHSLSWTLSYQFKNLIELNIGSQHVIAGKNVMRTHEFFASLVAVF